MFNLTTFRARTRGKAPKEFTFQGVGKAVARILKDKDNNPQVKDSTGKLVEYSYKRENDKWTASAPMSVDEKGQLVIPEGYSFVTVDDVDVSGLVPETATMDELKSFLTPVVALYGGEAKGLRGMLLGALKNFNEEQKQNAAPVSETVKEDDLAEIVNLLRENKIYTTDEEISAWRRRISMAFEQFANEGESKLDFAFRSKEGKKVADKRTQLVGA